MMLLPTCNHFIKVVTATGAQIYFFCDKFHEDISNRYLHSCQSPLHSCAFIEHESLGLCLLQCPNKHFLVFFHDTKSRHQEASTIPFPFLFQFSCKSLFKTPSYDILHKGEAISLQRALPDTLANTISQLLRTPSSVYRHLCSSYTVSCCSSCLCF